VPDLTRAIARLLVDEELRRDPVAAAERLGIPELARLDPAQLEAQARTLLRKRFHEVRKLVPQTIANLGPQAACRFEEFAHGFWPTGHRRHLQDALRFCEALGSQANRAETHRVRFALGPGRMALYVVSDLLLLGRRRRALQILFRGRRIREWAVFFRLD
jgi:hypothetical protein